jgi:hypothetical protein
MVSNIYKHILSFLSGFLNIVPVLSVVFTSIPEQISWVQYYKTFYNCILQKLVMS